MFDLIIIGGGPAGSSAAITATSGWARVLLLERGRFPRHKVCGEFVSAESLGLLETLLGPGNKSLLAEAPRISQGRLFLDGRVITTSIQPPAASIARFDLDPALWQRCLEVGVDARDGITVQSIGGSGPFQVATSDGDFEGRAVIQCSGRWSNLNAVMPAHGSQEKWLGIKGHFSERKPSQSVDLYFFEGGYCGVQPVDLRADKAPGGRINACAMVRAKSASSLREVFASHPALAKRAADWEPLSEPVTTSPLFFRDPQPLRDGVLLAGDVAGFVDPFVGDGISLALRSGALAARSLLPFFRNEQTLEEARTHYAGDYENQLAPVFRASSKLRRGLMLPRIVRAPILAVLERIPAATRFLVSRTR